MRAGLVLTVFLLAGLTVSASEAQRLRPRPGGHFEVIAPTSTAWPIVRDKVVQLLK